MSVALVYLLGLLATWGGFVLLGIAGVAFVLRRSAVAPLAFGTASALVGGLASRAGGSGSVAIPLVWLVVPFEGWVATVSTLLALTGVARLTLAFLPSERKAWATRTLVAATVALASGAFWASQPSHRLEVLRGRVELSFAAPAGLVGLALVSVIVMRAAFRTARGRKGLSALATHAALVSGSVVFGLPFAWLVLTSFKEDRDINSTQGLVWLPQVTVTAPYLDPVQPTYEAVHQGIVVRGRRIEAKGEAIRIDVAEPLGLRGRSFWVPVASARVVARQVPLVVLPSGARGLLVGPGLRGQSVLPLGAGKARVEVADADLAYVRRPGLRWQNYSEALQYLPPETAMGLVYLKNTMILVVGGVVGTLISCSMVAYGFARIRFPGRDALFGVLLATMMLPGAVTMLPTFLIFRSLGWVDTLLPLWVPAFFASAFNVFMLRQFFMGIPAEFDDAAKIDGCTYFRTFWQIMLPQIKPALAVISIWTFMGAWNSFMGPLIYLNSPEKMPLAYALQLFSGDRASEPGLMMAFATMSMIPVLALFFFAQRYFIEGVSLSGLGGR